MKTSQGRASREASLEARLAPKDNSLHPFWRCSDSKQLMQSGESAHCFLLNAVSKVFQDSEDLNQQSLIKQQINRVSKLHAHSPLKRNNFMITNNQHELDQILNQTDDLRQTFVTHTKKRSNSVRLLATAQVSEKSFKVFFDQVEQLRLRLLQLRQENKNLALKNRALKKQVSDLQAKLEASRNNCS